MTNMTNILNRAANTVEPPKQLPAGQYLFNVMSYADKDDQGNLLTSSGGHQKVDFLVQAIAPLEVDPAQMEGVNLPFRMRHSMVRNQLWSSCTKKSPNPARSAVRPSPNRS